MKKRRSFEFSKILMIALIISFSFLIAGIVGININKDLGNINSVVNSGNIVDPDDTDGSYETLNYSQKDIGKTVETVGSGTEEDPYIISNIDQFLYLTGTGRYGTMKGIYEERELAEGYTQIDFLQSNVWAYIDTEYYPNANTKIEYILNNPTSDNFSTGASTNNVKFMSSLNSSYGTGFACNSTTQIYQVPTKGWHKFTMCGNGNYYVDDSLVLQTGSFMEQIENSVYIYALNYDDTIYTGSGRGYGQLYSYKIYEGETLVKDFVPCETSEGLVGLYDVVEGKFHENKGTNDFIKGSRWVAHSKNYLENAYIELGNDLCFNDGYFDEDGVYYDGGDGELWTWNKNGPWGGLNFKGVFDGKGNEIQGLYGIAPDWSAFASYLFYSLNGATIKNIVFNNVNLGFYSHYCGATVCSKATDSLIENVKIYGRLTNPVAAGLSGVVYEAINTTFNCCENFATIICKSGQPSAAGFVARATSCKFFNCKNYGDIEGAYAASCYTSYATDCYFENCENHGDLNGGKEYSSIFNPYGGNSRFYKCKNYGSLISGRAGISSADYSVIDSCENYGDIYGGYSAISNNGSATVRNCKNYGYMVNGGSGIGYAKIIENCENYGVNCTSGIASTDTKMIINCINYSDVKSSGIGIVAEGGSISGCINYGNVNATGNCGGISASVKQGVTIVNCINYGKINDSNTSNQNQGAGGIVGSVDSQNVTIKNCTNYGSVASYFNAGGILGRCVASNLTIIGCRNYSDVSRGVWIGGLVGQLKGGNNTILGCINKSKVTASYNAGGFVGACEGANLLIKDCYNEAEVICTSSSTQYRDMVFGFTYNGSSLTIENCINKAKMNFSNGSANGFSKNISISRLKNCIDESDLNGTKSKQAFGKDFSGFYWSWRTGKIGIKSIDGNGLFQGDVNAEYLQKQGFEGDYMPEEPDSGNDLYSKYTQLEYIESTGTQYIDTGIIPTNGTKVAVTYVMTNGQQAIYPSIFGAQNQDDGLNSISLTAYGQTGESYIRARTAKDTTLMSDVLYKTNQEYEVEVSLNKLLVNGKVYESSGQEWDQFNYSIYIFTRNTPGIKEQCMSSYKLYSFKIYNGSETVRSFIPAKRNKDGAVGLYDTVEGKFYTNQGTGDFVAGTKESQAPSGYQELKAITIVNDSVNGYTNGINTGVSWSEINKIKITNSTPSAANAGRLMILKSDGSGSPWIGYGGNNQYVTFNGLTGMQTQEYKVEEYVGGDKKEILYEVTSTSANKIIYGCWQDASWSGTSTLYSMEMYKDETLVRSFVPAKRDSDGAVGLYDTVEGKFYTNQGTGDFVAGAAK